MDFSFSRKSSRSFRWYRSPVTCKCLALFAIALFYSALLLPSLFGNRWPIIGSVSKRTFIPNCGFRFSDSKFLEVPQIVWGLNNQKIAFARACLTAKMLNRTLLMPSLSASLFYKDTRKLEPISFDKVYQFEKFNSLCKGFVQLGRYSDIRNQTGVYEIVKGSGRKWTAGRDLEQLMQAGRSAVRDHEVIRIVGKNPFLWHDHWPVKDYARVFECMVVIDEIAREADKVVSRIREVGLNSTKELDSGSLHQELLFQPYVAVHMRIEIDWIIHCKNLEKRFGISQICSSKEEITKRVMSIKDVKTPTVVYLAVADSLLQNSSVLTGWGKGFVPLEKKSLGVADVYAQYPYLIRSAIDYEVCLRADVFVGNSFSTFSNLVVLERTQKMIGTGIMSSCNSSVRWPSYAYNIAGESSDRPQKWMTKMTDSNLEAVSYGSNNISCASS